MEKIPSRDITGKCDEGECRNRVYESDKERQHEINKMKGMDYSEPAENSPSWTKKRNDPPGWLGGRV
jgi:hypothetical protein